MENLLQQASKSNKENTNIAYFADDAGVYLEETLKNNIREN